MRIAIADDHPIVVEGIVEFLKKQSNVEIAFTATDGDGLLDRLHHEQVDVVLMDINMPKRDGISTTRLLKMRFPSVKVIIFSMYNEATYLRQLYDAGADGFLVKTNSTEHLMDAIMRVSRNERYFHEHPNDDTVVNSKLSDREKEVVQLFVQGIKSKEIADRLHISELTVRTHQKNVYRKLKLNSLTELAAYALNHNLLK